MYINLPVVATNCVCFPSVRFPTAWAFSLGTPSSKVTKIEHGNTNATSHFSVAFLKSEIKDWMQFDS